jgi:hypothetical protein
MGHFGSLSTTNRSEVKVGHGKLLSQRQQKYVNEKTEDEDSK